MNIYSEGITVFFDSEEAKSILEELGYKDNIATASIEKYMLLISGKEKLTKLRDKLDDYVDEDGYVNDELNELYLFLYEHAL